VEGRRASVKDLLDELWKLGAGSPLTRQSINLCLSRNFPRHKEPEETLRKGLIAAGGFWEEFLAFGDGLATEADTLV